MAEFHIDEPREIGKKKDRLSSKEKNMLKAMNIESIIQDNTCIHCENIVDENLRKWFKDKWVNIGKKVGGKHPPCGTSGKKRGYAKCVPASKARSMSKKQKASATRRKRAAQNKAGRGGTSSLKGGGKKPINVKTKAENTMNEMKSLKQLLSKIKGGKMDKKTARDLENLITTGDGFVVITKSKKDGYNRFNANRVDDRGIEVVPHMRDFRPGKVRGMMRHKPEHLLGDINWKDVKDMYMENKMNLKLEELVGKPITEAQFDEAAGEKDACYRKVKARYDVWPSAYASGALVKCRKVGAANWGNKSKKENVKETKVWSLDEKCWKGYEKKGTKMMFGKRYPNCVKKEGVQANVWLGENELYYESNTGEFGGYTFNFKKEDINEAEYQGRKVKLNKIMQGDAKKFKVYVKNPKGNVVKVNFGQGGDAKGGTMRIRKSNPKARANFRARHNCDNPGPKHKARYWSCRKW